MNNWSLKILALVVAGLLFWFVNSQMNARVISLVVPVEFRNLPADRVILLPRQLQAQLAIKGPAFLVTAVAASAPTIRVVLPSELGNRHKVVLREDLLNLPTGIQILSIEPAELELILDEVRTRMVPVEVSRLGLLHENLRLVELKVEPKEVELQGPETEIRAIDRVETLPVDLRNVEGDFRVEVALRPPGNLSKVAQRNVVVEGKVVPVVVEREFEALSLELRTKNVVRVRPEPAKVYLKISGARGVVQKLTEMDVIPFIRLDEIKVGQNSAKVEVDLPTGLTVVTLRPAEVRLVLLAPADGKEKE